MSMTQPELRDLASRMLDMLERVQWVRREGGNWHHCPFCHHVSERDLGPGHAPDCEWVMVTHEGNELRMAGILR
jgi:hypothetical protein